MSPELEPLFYKRKKYFWTSLVYFYGKLHILVKHLFEFCVLVSYPDMS